MKRIKNIFPLVLLCLGFSSCLEDDYLTGDNHESQNVIDFLQQPSSPASASEIYPVYVRSVPISAEEEVRIPISYSGSNQAPEDIVVNVSIDPAMLTAYNKTYEENAIKEAVGALVNPTQEEIEEATEHAIEEAEAHAFDLLPSNLFTMPTQVTIKQGERHADLVLKLKSDMFDFAYKYGLPLKLTSSQGTVSSNFGTAIFQIGGKNEWDGSYTNTYSRTRTDGSQIVAGTNTAVLSTAGALSLSGNLIGYYSNVQNLVINPTTNKVTVSSPGIAITNDVSYYDPATKTFFIQYVALNTVMKSTMVRK